MVQVLQEIMTGHYLGLHAVREAVHGGLLGHRALQRHLPDHETACRSNGFLQSSPQDLGNQHMPWRSQTSTQLAAHQ